MRTKRQFFTVLLLMLVAVFQGINAQTDNVGLDEGEFDENGRIKVNDLYFWKTSESTVAIGAQKGDYWSTNYMPSGDVEIPDKIEDNSGKVWQVTSIKDLAFFACKNINSITIPKTINKISETAFKGCVGLAAINVDSENPNYTSEAGVLFDKAKETLIAFPAAIDGEYTVISSVKTIKEDAFRGSKLSKITIHGKVAVIEDYAFYNNKLEEIEVAADNANYVSENGVLFDKAKKTLMVYPAGKADKTYKIPGTVIDIARAAFAKAAGLTSVDLSSVEVIDDYAFEDCAGFTTITFPATVTYIGASAFENCEKVATIISYIENPNEVELGDYAFNNTGGRWSTVVKVPAGKVEAYRNSGTVLNPKWNKYAHIVEMTTGTLSVTPTSKSMSKEGGNIEFTVTSDNDWKVETSANWIELSGNLGAKNGTVTATVAPNKGEERSANIVFTTGGVVVSVAIMQAAGEDTPSVSFSVTPEALSFMAAGEGKTVAVTADSGWTVSTTADWLELSTEEGDGNGTVTITATANSTTEVREATVTFSTYDDETKVVKVTQEAGNSGTSTFTVTPEVLSFVATGESKTVNLTVPSADTYWWVESYKYDWVHLSIEEGEGNATVTIRLDANDTPEAREATISFATDNEAKKVTLKQAAGDTAVEAETSLVNRIWSARGVLYVDYKGGVSAVKANVFAPQGVKVAGVVLHEGENAILLESGVYLVRIAGETHKVIVE